MNLLTFRPGAYREVQQAQVPSASPCRRGSGGLGCAIYGYLKLALDHLTDFFLRMEVLVMDLGFHWCLIERNLHAIRVSESCGFIAPRSHDRSVDDSRSRCQQPLHCGIEIGYL